MKCEDCTKDFGSTQALNSHRYQAHFKIDKPKGDWVIREKAVLLDALLAISKAPKLQSGQYPLILSEIMEELNKFLEKRYAK